MRNITFLFLAILGFRRKNLGGNRFSREICRSEKTLTSSDRIRTKILSLNKEKKRKKNENDKTVKYV